MLKKELDITNIELTEYIANVNIHRHSKLSKKEFLNRLEYVKAIRVRDESIHYDLKTLEDLKILKYLHDLIRNGNFKGYIFEKYIQKYKRQIFIFGIPSNIYWWLRNTEFEIIQKQLYNWQVASFFIDDELKMLVEDEIHPFILKDIIKIKKEYYDKYRIDSIDDYDEFDFKKIYNNISIELTGALPPKFLDYPFLKYGINSKDWRIKIGPTCNFTIEIGYFTEFDWISKFEKNQNKFEKYLGKSFNNIDFEDYLTQLEFDSLERSDSKLEFWEIWKSTFENYDISNSFIYEKLSIDNECGNIYLIKEELNKSIKIGWTKSNVEKRLLALQTGNSQNLIIVGYFRTSSIRTEKALHQKFKNKRISNGSEWFNLNENDINNILDSKWRIENNIF